MSQMTPEQLEAIKERATDLLAEIHLEADRVAIRATVELYVSILDRASQEVLEHDAAVAHDFAVGLPGWKRVEADGLVIAGPAGHWYAMLAGELVARPRLLGETQPPAAPLLDEDGNEVPGDGGWYAPDDLQGPERAEVLSRLGRSPTND